MSLVVQPSLFGFSGEPGLAELGAAVERRELSDGAWIDLRPGFVTAADELFDALAGSVPWHEERMRMYDSTVRVPRLLARYAAGRAAAPPRPRRGPVGAERPLWRGARRAVRQCRALPLP